MKAKIIGTIFVLAVLGAAYIITFDENLERPPTGSQPPSEPAFQPLKIN